MTHIAKEKIKLLNRLKRMRGQIEAMERAVDADDECATVLQQATACRGALDGFIAEAIRYTPEDGEILLAAEELIEVVHQYLKK